MLAGPRAAVPRPPVVAVPVVPQAVWRGRLTRRRRFCAGAALLRVRIGFGAGACASCIGKASGVASIIRLRRSSDQ